jgi:Xaa-Pro aminopeptidase
MDYAKRWKNIKKKLNADAFVARMPGNIKYLSYSETPIATNYFIIIPKDGQPIAVTSALDHSEVKKGSIKDVRTIGDLPYVKTYEKRYKNVLKRILGEIGAKKIISDSKIGMKSKIIDIVRDLRMYKDGNEIKCIRTAANIVKRTANELESIVRPGKSEMQIAEELNHIVIERGSQIMWPWEYVIASGKNAANPHHYPTKKIIKKGEAVVCDFGAYYNGYMSDIT